VQLGSPCSVVVAARLCIRHAALKKDIMAGCQLFHGRGLHSTGIAVVLSTPAKSTLL